jgi:hypothetical protein
MRRPSVLTAPKLVALGVVGLCVASAPSGCAFDWQFPSDGGANGGDAAGLDGEVGDAGLDAFVPPDDSGPNPATCTAPTACPPGQYCAFADHACGKGVAGTCKPDTGGSACTPVTPASDQVCGCDQNLYATTCAAFKAGVDYGTAGCPVPSGAFRCGYRFCSSTTEFCKATKSTNTYDCVSLGGCSPAACSCSAVANTACACVEKTASANGVTVSCP